MTDFGHLWWVIVSCLWPIHISDHSILFQLALSSPLLPSGWLACVAFVFAVARFLPTLCLYPRLYLVWLMAFALRYWSAFVLVFQAFCLPLHFGTLGLVDCHTL